MNYIQATTGYLCFVKKVDKGIIQYYVSPLSIRLDDLSTGDKELRAKESQTTPPYTIRSILLYIYKLSRVENERSGY